MRFQRSVFALLFLALVGCGEDSKTDKAAGKEEAVASGGGVGGEASAGEAGSGSADKKSEPVDPGNGDTDVVFDQEAVRTIEVELDADQLEALDDNPASEEYQPATVKYNGLNFTNAAIRYKGDFGSLYSCLAGEWQNLIGRDCDKLNFKLKFDEYDDAGRFYGLKRLNLHAMDKDYSRIRESVAYRIFREFGVPASRTAYVKLMLYGEFRGLFLAVEAVDGRFARANFDDGAEGNLYKQTWFEQTNLFAWTRSLETNKDEDPNITQMVDMATALNVATAKTFKTTLPKWVDVDLLMKYLAVEQAIGHWDSTTAFYCDSGFCGNHNYYLYQHADQQKVVLVPWDLDFTLGNFDVPNLMVDKYGVPAWNDLSAPCEPIATDWSEVVPATCDPFIRNIAESFGSEYSEATTQLLDTVYQTDKLTSWIDSYAKLIAPVIAEDKLGPSPSQWEDEVAALKERIGTLRERAEASIERQNALGGVYLIGSANRMTRASC
jgi:hypothetical protein